MAAATEKELSALHAKLAKQLNTQLDQSDRAMTLLIKYRADEALPDDVVRYLEDAVDAVSPALLTVVSKFLKDNDITAVVEENKELSELDKRLAEKRTRRTVGKVIPMTDEE